MSDNCNTQFYCGIFRNLLISILLWIPFISIYSSPATTTTFSEFAEDTLKVSQYLDKAEIFISNPDTRDSAIHYLNMVLDISDTWENDYALYPIYDRLMNIYGKVGNFTVSLDYAFKMLKILDHEIKYAKETLPLYEKYQVLYKDIGYYLHFSDLEKALFYQKKSIETAELIYSLNPYYPINQKKIMVYNNMGSMFTEVNRFDSAEFYFNKVLKYNQELDEPLYNATIYNNIGIIRWEQGKYEEAYNYLNQSVALKEELKDTAGLASSYLNLGKCSYIQNNYQLAKDQYHKSLKYSRQTMNIRIEAIVLESLAELYEELKDYKRSNEYLKQAVIMKDSLNNGDKIKFGLSTEMQYQFERRKEEGDLKQKIIIANKERDVLISVFIICLLAFILILLFFLYHNQRLKTQQNIIEKERLYLRNENLKLKNEQLTENLETKYKELDMHAKYLLKKKESSNLALEQIAQIKNQDTEKSQEINLEELKTNLEESVWNEFKILFQDLHQEFYTNLNNKHPNLTPNEKKLCTFIRLNMSTKEISSITLQQTKTIEIARSRLRNKLRLERHENLTSYLQQF